jgi:cytochrome c oxidase subunit 2
MKKFLYIFLTYFISSNAFANQPKDWQLGFQEAASSTMRDIVNFHDKILLPIIIAISVFVLFLMVYACIRFRASRNPNPSKTTHNVAVEVLWTLIPCLILIVMAVPSFQNFIQTRHYSKSRCHSEGNWLPVVLGVRISR